MRSKQNKKWEPLKLNAALDGRLMTYVSSAAAAGVTALALAQPAAAEIVYTPANINCGGSYAIDLNHDGIKDFTLRIVSFDSGHGRLQSMVLDVPGNGVLVGPLAIGSGIGPQRRFSTVADSYGGVLIDNNFFYGEISHSSGPWFNVTNKFMGFKFLIGSEFHYGWARFTFSGAMSATLTGYAYETVPNRGIRAGQRHGTEADSSAATPRESAASNLPALGLLASGTVGLATWRR